MIQTKIGFFLGILFLNFTIIDAHNTGQQTGPTIVFCGMGFAYHGGGTSTHVKALASRLKQDNFNIIFLSQTKISCSEWCASHGIEYIYCQNNEMLEMLEGLVKNNPSTIISVNGNTYALNKQMALFRSRNPKAKIVQTIHCCIQKGWAKNLAPNIMTFVDCTAGAKITHPHLYWTPPLYDDQKFKDVKITCHKDEFIKTIPSYNDKLALKNQPFILTVPSALITTNKNQLCAVKAVAELISRHAINCHLLLLGTQGKAAAAVHELISQLNIKNHVHFLGFRTDICEVMHFSDGIIVPSKIESFGLPVIEAALLKKPIIVSNSTRAALFFIDHNKTGLSFISDDAYDLATQIMKLYSDSKFAQQLGTNAYIRAKNEFSSQALYNTFKQIYMKLLT